jgi:beta-lactamase class A
VTPSLPPPLAAEVRGVERAFSGVIGIWVHDLGRRHTYGLRAEEHFAPASTIKLFVLRELFRQVDAGQASLSEEVVVRRRDVVPGSGVLRDLGPDLRLSLGDAAMLMVTVSDNVAANLLIDRLGTRAINRGTQAAGFADTRLGGKLFGRHRLSRTTPRDVGTLMLQIARRQAVSRTASAAMLGMLRREQSHDIVGRRLPHEPADRGDGPGRLKVASKSGSLAGVRHDVAYVEGRAARYVVALMSRECADLRFSVDNEATLCLAHVARLVHEQASR